MTATGLGAWSPSVSAVPVPIGIGATIRPSRSTARPGDNITYTISITNTSPWTAASVSASVSLPSRTGFVAATGSPPGGGAGEYAYYPSSNTVVFQITSIPAGESITRTVTARVLDGVTTGESLRARLVVVRPEANGSVVATAATAGVAGAQVAPSVPRNVRLEVVEGNVAFLSWDAVTSFGSSYVQRYVVQRSTSAGGPWTNIGELFPYDYARFQFGDGLRTAGQQYYYRIAAVNGAGYGVFSTPLRG